MKKSILVLLFITIVACIIDYSDPTAIAGIKNAEAITSNNTGNKPKVIQQDDTRNRFASYELKASKKMTKASVIKSTNATVKKTAKTTVKKKVIFNKSGIKVTVLSFDETNNAFGKSLKLKVTNSTKEFMDIHVEDLSVNGFMIDYPNMLIVAPGENNDTYIFFPKDSLKLNKIKNIMSIDFRLVAYDNNSGDTLFHSNIITIKTSAKKVTQTYDDSGKVLYNENKIKIISKGLVTSDSADSSLCRFYMENNTNKEVYISYTFSPSIKTGYSNYWCSILPGKKINTQFYLYESDFGKNVSISFSIYETNLNGRLIVKTNPIALNLNDTGDHSENNTSSNHNSSTETTSIEEQVIYIKGGITVTALSLKDSEGITGKEMMLHIENRTQAYVVMWVNGLSINGYMSIMSSGGSYHIEPGKEAIGSIFLNSSDMKQYKIDKIASMEFKILIYKGNKTEETDTITIDTSAKNEYTQTYDTSGEVLYNENNIEIILKDQGNNYSSGPNCWFYVENNTDKELFISFEFDPYILREDTENWCTVMPGKKANCQMYFDRDILKSDINVSFSIYETDATGLNRKLLYQTEPIVSHLDVSKLLGT